MPPQIQVPVPRPSPKKFVITFPPNTRLPKITKMLRLSQQLSTVVKRLSITSKLGGKTREIISWIARGILLVVFAFVVWQFAAPPPILVTLGPQQTVQT